MSKITVARLYVSGGHWILKESNGSTRDLGPVLAPDDLKVLQLLMDEGWRVINATPGQYLLEKEEVTVVEDLEERMRREFEEAVRTSVQEKNYVHIYSDRKQTLLAKTYEWNGEVYTAIKRICLDKEVTEEEFVLEELQSGALHLYLDKLLKLRRPTRDH
ncbi:hypothetical protein D1872_51110 [compost metagenome]